jgi:hypothetical protein
MRVERRRELGRLDFHVEAGILDHRLYNLRDFLRVGCCRSHQGEGRVRDACLGEQCFAFATSRLGIGMFLA